MTLEELEQHCLRHLEGSKNPLVSFDALKQMLQRESDTELPLTEAQLVDFLRHHETMEVRETPGIADNPELALGLEREGLGMGLCVILNTRIPSQFDFLAMMIVQLDALTDALTHALQEAKDNESRTRQVVHALERIKTLKDRIRSELRDG